MDVIVTKMVYISALREKCRILVYQTNMIYSLSGCIRGYTGWIPLPHRLYHWVTPGFDRLCQCFGSTGGLSQDVRYKDETGYGGFTAATYGTRCPANTHEYICMNTHDTEGPYFAAVKDPNPVNGLLYALVLYKERNISYNTSVI